VLEINAQVVFQLGHRVTRSLDAHFAPASPYSLPRHKHRANGTIARQLTADSAAGSSSAMVSVPTSREPN
jgi:hypothetical protein